MILCLLICDSSVNIIPLEFLLLPRRGSPKIMKYIESYFLEITFIVSVFSVINMVSSNQNKPDQIESKVASQILCR